MRRRLGFRVLVWVCLGSVVAAPQGGRVMAEAVLSPPAGEALQGLITTACAGCESLLSSGVSAFLL
jgi:hypothetical protein